jgi:hypothetical protein
LHTHAYDVCHSRQDVHRSTDAASRTNHANLEATCRKWHGNEKLVKGANLPGGNVGTQFHDSIHGKLLADGSRAADAPTCTNCHGAHAIRKSDEASRFNPAHIPETCGGYHQAIYARFSKGQHGKLRNEGNSHDGIENADPDTLRGSPRKRERRWL